MTDTNTGTASQIKEHMPVVCSDGGQFATVDHLDAGNTIKLTKDDQGQHHWIPAGWVTSVDDKVHVDRPGKQAMQDWSTTGPTGA
ncbi:MAG: DUF2171 domain-containing protein [Chloroflexia bacterium]|jgi:hypothetical protein|nr:DUF2171 domain-containing protein [Chloroflexia bacterium]